MLDRLEMGATAMLVIGIVVMLLGGIGYIVLVETVDEGERGVMKQQGAVTGEVFEPGWHWPIVPFYENVVHIEVRPRTYTMSGNIHEGDVKSEDAVTFMSADQQQVGVDITVRYKIEEDDVDDFHSQWKTESQFEARLLRPEIINTVAREGSALNATEANSDDGRARLAEVAIQSLASQAPDSVIIESVQVRDIHLDPEFRKNLEQVEIANAEAEAARERARGDADAERIRAEGDADAFRTRQKALTKEILMLEQIDAYDDGTVYVVDPSQNTIVEVENNNDSEDSNDFGN